MKYMVMECHPGYAVVLSEDGQFLKAANRNYTVGETVTDVILMQVPQKQEKKNILRLMRPLVAVAACLVLMFTVFFYQNGAYASVYITINPQVRIDVNRRDMVVGLEGVNQDGIDLIAGYEYSRKDLDTVMDELVQRAITMGYLHEGGQVTLTLDGADEQWKTQQTDHLSQQLNQYLAQTITVTIDVQTLPKGETFPRNDDDTDYGDSDYADTPYESRPQETVTDYGEGQTDYDADTDYGADSDGVTDYDDTDYGPDNDGVTDYEPTSQTQPDTDYGPDSDGVTDYDDTDYEGIDSFGIQWNRVEPSGVFHLTKHTKPVPFHLKKLDF